MSGSWIPITVLLLVYAAIVAPLVVAPLIKSPDPAMRPVLAAMVAVGFCVLVQMLLHLGLVVASNQSWNWLGKVLQAGACLVLAPVMGGQMLGLKLALRRLLDRRALAVAVLVVCAAVVIWFLVPPDENSPPHALLYQATLPGLAEELFYRGALPALCAGIAGRHSEPRPVAYVACTAIFVVDHVLKLDGGNLLFSLEQLWAPLLIGSALAYIRVRTGSVYLGILVHNVFNVVASGFGR